MTLHYQVVFARDPQTASVVAEIPALQLAEFGADLPEALRVRRFVLLHKPLDADDDEITRTRKIRRRVIAERTRRSSTRCTATPTRSRCPPS